ncbi:MAG: DUF4430 domain-containing protein [Promethearchaeota archaeon]
MWEIAIEKTKLRNIIISLSFVIGIVIIGNVLYFGTDWFKPSSNGGNSDYSWDTDPQRLTFPESISNITLEIYYGEANGTTELYENISLTDHYTTIFDIMNLHCDIEYEISWWAHPTFFITGINGVIENDAEQHWWQYEVNGSYVPSGANAYSPANNSLVRWYLT